MAMGELGYSRVRWTSAAVIVAILFYGLVIARFVATPRMVGFRLVILLLLTLNLLWWAVADRRLARYVAPRRLANLIRVLMLVFMLGLNLPLVLMLVGGRTISWIGSPTWYAAAVTLWHLGLVVGLPCLGGLRLLGLAALRCLVWLRGRVSVFGRTPPPRPGALHEGIGEALDENPDGDLDPGRRAILHTAVATVPMLTLGGLTIAGRVQEGRFAINRHALAAPWLASRLHGLTITHISDLHVGRLYRPHMLRRLVDEANRLDSDIVVVTGDIIDNSNDLLPPTLDALGRLSHRHGIFLSIGNHDMIDDRATFIRLVRERFPLLINQRRTLSIGGERLTIAGLDFAWRDGSNGRAPGYQDFVQSMMAGYHPDAYGPIIALSHHPHAFDLLAAAGVPLTLSGHTHGGQLMLTPPGERPEVGIGRLLFRYISGFYHHGESSLFVNSGVGNWFPLRIHAPAEIVQIQLTP